jgi:hypothetical protein
MICFSHAFTDNRKFTKMIYLKQPSSGEAFSEEDMEAHRPSEDARIQVTKKDVRGNELLDLFKALIGPNWHLFLESWTDHFAELKTNNDNERAVQASCAHCY